MLVIKYLLNTSKFCLLMNYQKVILYVAKVELMRLPYKNTKYIIIVKSFLHLLHENLIYTSTLTFLKLNNIFLAIDNLITHFAFSLSITSRDFYCYTFTKFLAIHNKLILLRLAKFYLKIGQLLLKIRLLNVALMNSFFESEAHNRSLRID